jgi:AraC-like DNA-binding protein
MEHSPTFYRQPPGFLAGFASELSEPGLPEIAGAGEQWAPARHRIPDHSHAFWEFHLHVSGQAVWEAQGEFYTLMPGSLFIAAPGVSHEMSAGTTGKTHLLFAGIALHLLADRLPDILPLWRNTTVFYTPRADNLVSPFRQLIREVSLDLPHRIQGIRSAIDSLVIEATRLIADDRSPRMPTFVAMHPSILQAKELLDSQIEQKWRVSELAMKVGLSPCYLVERFTKEVGQPPHQYLLQARIDRARELLTNSNLSITTLALELGFSSGQHFATMFKRMVGQTPHQYRREQHGGARDHAGD